MWLHLLHLALIGLAAPEALAHGPPRISSLVHGQQWVYLGQNIRLPCPVTGDPPPLTMWTKDGRNINSGWLRFRMLPKSLRIERVEWEDAGVYVCKAANGFGSIRINYTLVLIDRPSESPIKSMDEGARSTNTGTPPRFTQPWRMRRRLLARPAGSSVRLKCTASGDPPPNITWFKDDHPLDTPVPTRATVQRKGRRRTKPQWTLTLRKLQVEDSGRYTCHVENPVGQINATYRVEVIQRLRSKPVLTGMHPVNTTVDLGGSTSLQCKVRSDVRPVVQWLKQVPPNAVRHRNATLDVDGRRYVVLPVGEVWSRPDGSYLNKLVISRARAQDAGMYICLGANNMGYSFRSAFLTVQAAHSTGHIHSQPVAPLTQPPTSLPWPVIVGIPAGAFFIVGSVLLWLCQTRRPKSCPHATCGHPTSSASVYSVPSAYRCPRDRLTPATDKLPYEDLPAIAPLTPVATMHRPVSTTGIPNHHTGVTIGPSTPVKGYVPNRSYGKAGGYAALDVLHTHMHTHVEGKVHQHHYTYYQC
uniref:fibroblast growth factor receptor-like 1 n=1 Tax=Myxine glutinosa TaxID=7769 RepID=UPI00358E25DE